MGISILVASGDQGVCGREGCGVFFKKVPNPKLNPNPNPNPYPNQNPNPNPNPIPNPNPAQDKKEATRINEEMQKAYAMYETEVKKMDEP